MSVPNFFQSKNSSDLNNNEILKGLVDSPQIMIWVTNEKHLCTYVNQPLLDFLGISNLQMMGLNWMERIHPDDRSKCGQVYQASLDNHNNYRQEFRVKTASGDYRWLLDIGVPRFNSKGKFIGYFGSDIDITSQKNQEETLRENKLKLERQVLEISEHETSRMAGDLHDSLCQELVGIALKAGALEKSLLQGQVPHPSQLSKITQQLNNSIRQARNIARSLSPLGFSNKNFSVALQELVEHLKEMFSVNLNLEIGSSLETINNENAIHLYRIIQEAVNNSIRHGKAKLIEISVKIGADDRGCLKIVDTGKGIPEDFRTRSGMGLHLMDYRAKSIGGNVEIKRGDGGGTEVTCFFKGCP